MRPLLLIVLSVALMACKEEVSKDQTADAVRGLKTVLIEDVATTTARHFPSVLQPSEVSSLSFEVAGKLQAIDLKVGEPVRKGDVIAALDPTSLEIAVDNAQAAVDLAQANAENAAEDLKRQEQLFEKGSVTKVSVDNARTSATTTAAQLQQSVKGLDTAKENLGKAVLRAPFDGIINTMDADSFATVSAGAPIATLYAAEAYEVSFSVNFEVANLLTVGKQAKIRLADNPTLVLDAVVSELGSRADTVSSFPVVVSVSNVPANVKAGMAVEVTLEFEVFSGAGFKVPLSASIREGQITPPSVENGPARLAVYVFDPDTSTVSRREVKVAGIRENSLLVVEGLSPGDRVASAGVSFLREGMKVKLLSSDK